MSSPLFCENSAQWDYSPVGCRRALCLIFGGSLKDFLSPKACMVKSSQCRVFWETIIFESIVKPHANTVRLSAFGTALFVLSRLCVKFGWESPICVNRVKTYSQTYPDIVPIVFDIWLVMLLLQVTTAQLDRFRSVLCQTYIIWDFHFGAIGI